MGDMTWVAWKPCGCVSCLIAMGPDTAASYARQVKRAQRLGLHTDFLPVETVRTMKWKCPDHAQEKQLSLHKVRA
jgi:hypothetical protein